MSRKSLAFPIRAVVSVSLAAVFSVLVGCSGSQSVSLTQSYRELTTEWYAMSHAQTWDDGTDNSNWLPGNHDSGTVFLRPVPESRLDPDLYYERASQTLKKAQPIVERVIELSGRSAPVFTGAGPPWGIEERIEFSSDCRSLARLLWADTRWHFETGDFDGVTARLVALYRISSQLVETEDLLGSLAAYAIRQMTDQLMNQVLRKWWEVGEPTPEHRDALLTVLRPIDPRDPFGYLAALRNEVRVVLDWAETTPDPIATAWDVIPQPEVDAARASDFGSEDWDWDAAEPVPFDSPEAFGAWVAEYQDLDVIPLAERARRVYDATVWVTEHWDELSRFKDDEQLRVIRENSLFPFAEPFIGWLAAPYNYTNDDYRIMQVRVWEDRGRYVDYKPTAELIYWLKK